MEKITVKKITVLGKKWFAKHQNHILWLCNAPIIKHVFRRILGIHDYPMGNKVEWITTNEILVFKGIFFENKKFVKKQYYQCNSYLFQIRLFKRLYPIWWMIHQWDTLFANNFAPQLNLGFDTLYEFFHPTTDNETYTTSAVTLKFQGFNPSIAHTVQSIVAKIAKNTSVGNVKVTVKAAGSDSKPTGSAIASDTAKTITSLPADGSGNGTTNTTITLGTTGNVAANTTYGYCLIWDGDTSTGSYGIMALVAGGYANGSLWTSGDGGSTWSDIGWDMYFEERGTATSINYPLTAAVGSFTMTGRTSTFGILMPGAVGTFIMTGVSATLAHGKGIAAAVGVFTMTGVAVTFKAIRSMVASVGTFTMTGVAVTFNLGRTLSAQVGQFILTGFVITFWGWLKRIRPAIGTYTKRIKPAIGSWTKRTKPPGR